MKFLSGAGLEPVMILPPDTADDAAELLSIVSGVMFVGGGDIRPFRYGAEDAGIGRGISDARDWSELLLAHGAIKDGVPLLGICRGAQVIAVALGGGLKQSVPAHESGEHKIYLSPYSILRTGSFSAECRCCGSDGIYSSSVTDGSAFDEANNLSAADSSLVSEKLNSSYAAEHGTTPEDISAAAHAASAGFFTCDDCIPFFPSSGEGISVNSYHHQSISDPGDGAITAMAEDGVAEMIELPGHPFCLGVQWHPEIDQTDPLSHRIAELFAESVYRRQKEVLGI
jgi:peptidase C26